MVKLFIRKNERFMKNSLQTHIFYKCRKKKIKQTKQKHRQTYRVGLLPRCPSPCTPPSERQTFDIYPVINVKYFVQSNEIDGKAYWLNVFIIRHKPSAAAVPDDIASGVAVVACKILRQHFPSTVILYSSPHLLKIIIPCEFSLYFSQS